MRNWEVLFLSFLACCSLAAGSKHFIRSFRLALDEALSQTEMWRCSEAGFSEYSAGAFDSSIILAATPIVSSSRRVVWFGNGIHEYAIKHYQDGGNGLPSFCRWRDPLIAEYAFGKALAASGLAAQIFWVSAPSLFDRVRDIDKMGLEVSPRELEQVLERNAFTRTIVQERVGFNMLEFIHMADGDPKAAVQRVFQVGRAVLLLLGRLHGIGVIHGDVAFRNVAFKHPSQQSLVSGLVFIDFENARLLGDSPGTKDPILSQYVWDPLDLPAGIGVDVESLWRQIGELLNFFIADENWDIPPFLDSNGEVSYESLHIQLEMMEERFSLVVF